MDAGLLFQVAGVGLVVTVLNLLLSKTDRSEYAVVVTVTGLVLVLALVTGEISTFFDTVRSVFSL